MDEVESTEIGQEPPCPYFFEFFYKNVLTNIEKYVII